MNILQVGTIEPSVADVLAAKYQVLQLPNDDTRVAFLAEHGASITAIVDFGPPGVDAELMKALPNLAPSCTTALATTPSTSTPRTGSASGSATTPTCSMTLSPTRL